MDQAMIEVKNLCKKYGTVEAVKDISFSIPGGSIFGLLGPNGAGKTSVIEMMEGIRIPDSGSIRVAGLNPVTQSRQVKQIIGAQLQTTALHDKIRIREVFHLFGSFYKAPKKTDEVLEMVGLKGLEDRFYVHLSGGEKQRVALGMALIGNPQVVFLDEPTSGLDVGIRNQLHELILRIRDEGRLVVMSTHYIEEAEKLCDLVAILDGGKLKAIASPEELIRMQKTEERVQVSFRTTVALEVLESLDGVSRVSSENGRFVLAGPDAGRIVVSVSTYSQAGAAIEEMKIFHANLEDVYLDLTTHGEMK